MEGAYVEEVAAIQVNAASLQIVDVFHAFAKSTREDQWARKHVHGLSKKFLEENAQYENSHELINGFRNWLKGKNVIEFFANDPCAERHWLPKFRIDNFQLPTWKDRAYTAPHVMALQFKRQWAPVLNRRCCAEAHSSFLNAPRCSGNEAKETALQRWGPHCALYDVLEEYFSYVYAPSAF